jgi:putative FmdB family regulatory protein
MILFDFKCSECDHTFEELVKSATRQIPCPLCEGTAYRVLLRPPRIDWLSMGAQRNASPEAIDRWERLHREQAIIEQKAEQDHGDYGPRPGAD